MSQFLLCKSKENLAAYGMKVGEALTNTNLYADVLNRYEMDRDIEEVWVINQIHDMLDQLDDHMNIIEEIISKSEWMLFWYGNEFQELEQISSRQELIGYLEENLHNPCLEIYLFAEFANQAGGD